MMQPLYLTCAIDYVNAKPHIGTAYEKIGADAMARFARLGGRDVHLLLGNDEHSTNVVKAAAKAGLAPLAYCDQMEREFRATWDRLGITYDDFIRTTAADHRTAVHALFAAIHARTAPDGSPNIFKGKYTGWYCESCEAYYTEKDLQGNQCPVHHLPATWVEEDNYFFALSKYTDFLMAHIRTHPEFILPAIRRNEIVRLIEGGLQDISMSRAGGAWGIHLPIDTAHTVYVWFDALINYITAAGYGRDPARFTHWWQHAEVVHVIGKDITRFHCVIWPAMLHAAGLPLPATVFGHGFVYHRGERMSKTLGNVVNPFELIDRYGPDPLRYFLLRENSFGRDADFTWETFIERYNGDLANGLGNFVSRTAGMVQRYLGGVVPFGSAPATAGQTPDALQRAIDTAVAQLRTAMDYRQGDVNFHDALGAVWSVIAAADKTISDAVPWNLHKAGRQDDVTALLARMVDVIRVVAVLCAPFLPTTAAKIWAQFGFAAQCGELAAQRIDGARNATQLGMLQQPIALTPAAALFPRIEQAKNEGPATQPAGARGASLRQGFGVAGEGRKTEGVLTVDQITIEDFAKVQLRVATIAAAEKVEGADRLLKLQVDLGDEQRQIVAGIAQHYTPDELVGVQVCVVANLKPATLRGIESQGMLLAASGGDTVSILTPLKPVPAGSRVK